MSSHMEQAGDWADFGRRPSYQLSSGGTAFEINGRVNQESSVAESINRTHETWHVNGFVTLASQESHKKISVSGRFDFLYHDQLPFQASFSTHTIKNKSDSASIFEPPKAH